MIERSRPQRSNFDQTRLISWLAFVALVVFGIPIRGEEPIDPLRFQVSVVAQRCADPMQMAVIDANSLIFIERQGRIVQVETQNGLHTELGQLPVAVFGEVGLMGLALDPKFNENQRLYVCYCPSSESHTLRLSRFTIVDQQVNLDSEKVLLSYPIDIDGAIHMGGGLCFDSNNNLILGTGDNCPPIAELPVDWRPGRQNFDAMRTSANSQDLRGKILRIRPLDDGSYEIPEGNLFRDPAEGRPEIYAMGCRNPFRVSVDSESNAIYWGDVGPNIELSLQLGPNGYDEINRATRAGNFGWPMFVGPNEAYRNFDFETRRALDRFDVSAPINSSPNNTGAKRLPPPQGSLIWYPSTTSSEFPWTGSGGRSAMAGPVYHADRFAHSPTRMPDAWNKRLLVYDWTRNWIFVVELNEEGAVTQAEQVLPDFDFRKPIDVAYGSSGELYVVEYGNLWGGNLDGRIVRIDYVRGNRSPEARLTTHPPAGQIPLQVECDARTSTDPDGDPLDRFEWTVDGRLFAETSSTLSLVFDSPGEHRVQVKVTDPSGSHSTATSLVKVGNAPPQIEFLRPTNGSIIDPDQSIAYQLAVSDAEDGSTEEHSIPSSRVLMEGRFNRRLAAGEDPLAEDSDPGLLAMRSTTCFSCHTSRSPSAGPAYRDVALRYASDPEARLRLAQKVVQGGAGAWSDKPMPPHPQHSIDEALTMVDWILSLAQDQSEAPLIGSTGYFRPQLLPGAEGGVWTLTGSYTDQGAPEATALRGEARLRLHSRRKRAPHFDRSQHVHWIDIFERGIGMAGAFRNQGWISCDEIDLSTIHRVDVHAAASGEQSVTIELRLDSPQGDLIGHVEIHPHTDALGEIFATHQMTIPPTQGVHNLYLVARKGSADNVAEEGPTEPSSLDHQSETCLLLNRLEFVESPQAIAHRQAEAAKRKQILLVATPLDHPFGTHMYREVCQILAACLNQHPDVEAIVAREDDFPTDPRLLDQIDAIVCYSRPAGDIVLSPQHREAFERMIGRGVGFTAIHWSTGAEVPLGPQYQSILGGWFNFEFAGIKVDRQPLVQVVPEHAICRGWNNYDLRDEFYLNLRFSDKAQPILSVQVDGQDQCVAWVLDREDGGRSFGTTLGHFHDNYSIPEFRRMLVNGILWTTNIEVPDSGSLVDVTPQLLELASPTPTVSHSWTTEELSTALRSREANPSYERGAQLFETASCAACHRIKEIGNTLGPDLTQVRVRFAAEPDPLSYLIREVLEPSAVIDPRYRSVIVSVDSGETLSGLLVEESDNTLTLATDPTRPDHRVVIDRTTVEHFAPAETSMMPTGLLDRLSLTQIHDLLTYIEAGGDRDYFAYKLATRETESWSDQALPVRSNLAWWLDARTLQAACVSQGLPEVRINGLIDRWPDGSGFQRDVNQRSQASQPHLVEHQGIPVVEFDGVDDWLGGTDAGLITREATVLIVAAPNNNLNWPGLVSGNSRNRNDYQSGFNIDLMPEPTSRWQSVMVEGPGFIGVQNLMHDAHQFGEFQILSMTTAPGSDTVRLRINGRDQGSRGREEGELVIDELAVAARYWSNDAGVPPFNRGFLNGRIAGVLLYSRVLDDNELAGLESYLWDYYKPLFPNAPAN